MGLQLHHRHEVSGAPDPLTLAMDIAFETVETVGPERIEIVTLTRDRICLQPVDLNQGEQIAHVLGCELPLDHRMFVPGHTLCAGERDGLEIQIRSVLRRTVAR